MGKLLKKLLARCSLSFSSSATLFSPRFMGIPNPRSMLCLQNALGDAECSCDIRLLGELESLGKSKKQKVRKGCVPVVVNGEHRLLLKASDLAHPLLVCLLQQTAQEMGYTWDYRGALRLSCDRPSFCHLLRLATTP